MRRTLKGVPVVLVILCLLVLFVVPTASARAAFAQFPDLPPVSPELLSSLYAGILSLLLSYVPGLNTRWAALPEDTKKAVMALGLIAISAGVFAAGCAPALGLVFIECSTGGALKLASILIAALWTNQAVHRISPATEAVRLAKARG